MKKVILLAGAIVLVCSHAFSQKKIVVMGSSTAVGTGASPYQNSWAGRLADYFRRNTSDGLDTVIENIATGGYTTYHEMPNGFVTPNNRPAVDPNRNVTKALSLSPNVIIINLPTNDVASGFSPKEYMDNLRTMYNTITARGVACFISTTQPRHLSTQEKNTLRSLVDSIAYNFGYGAIDFYNGLATADGDIAEPYRTPDQDGIHLNNSGHEILFQRVSAKQLFIQAAPLPLRLLSFKVKESNNSIELTWTTAEEEDNTLFEIERSGEGSAFKVIASVRGKGIYKGANYQWTDPSPQNGKNNYRIKIIEGNHVTYSGVASAIIAARNSMIKSVYVNKSAGSLTAMLNAVRGEHATLMIVSAVGQVIKTLQPQTDKVTISLAGVRSGQYFLVLRAGNGTKETKGFIVE